MTDAELCNILALATARGDAMHIALCQLALEVELTVWCPAPIVEGHRANPAAGRRAAEGAILDWLEELDGGELSAELES